MVHPMQMEKSMQSIWRLIYHQMTSPIIIIIIKTKIRLINSNTRYHESGAVKDAAMCSHRLRKIAGKQLPNHG